MHSFSVAIWLCSRQGKTYGTPLPNLYTLTLRWARRVHLSKIKAQNRHSWIALMLKIITVNGEETFFALGKRLQEYAPLGLCVSPQADYVIAVKIKSAGGFDLLCVYPLPHFSRLLSCKQQYELWLVLIRRDLRLGSITWKNHWV